MSWAAIQPALRTLHGGTGGCFDEDVIKACTACCGVDAPDRNLAWTRLMNAISGGDYSGPNEATAAAARIFTGDRGGPEAIVWPSMLYDFRFAESIPASLTTSGTPTLTDGALNIGTGDNVTRSGSFDGAATWLFHGKKGGAPAGLENMFEVTDGTANEEVKLLLDNPPLVSRGLVISGLVNEADITGSDAWIYGDTRTLSLAYAANDAELVEDGTSLGTDNTVALPSGLDAFRIGSELGGIRHWAGWVYRVAKWDSRLATAIQQRQTS